MKQKTVSEYIEEMKSMQKKAIPVVAPVINNDGLGSVIAIVSFGNGFNPIENATVTVYDSESGEIIEQVKTDSSGKTRLISLPTVRKSESLTPNGSSRVFNVYDIEASKENFITARRNNIPVFDEEVSIQQFNLIWKFATDSQSPTVENEGNPYNL